MGETAPNAVFKRVGETALWGKPPPTRFYLEAIERLPRDTERYREIPRDTERYREIPRDTERYREIPRDTERYREIPRDTERYREIIVKDIEKAKLMVIEGVSYVK